MYNGEELKSSTLKRTMTNFLD
jgi:hypothetical protein